MNAHDGTTSSHLGSDDAPRVVEPYEAPRAEAIGSGLVAVVPGGVGSLGAG